IARRWTAAGLPSTKTGKAWTGRGVRNVLVSPRYAGIATYKGREVGRGGWEPILDLETHLALVTRLTDPSRTLGASKAGRKPGSLLSGIALCGKCQAPARGSGDGRGNLKY